MTKTNLSAPEADRGEDYSTPPLAAASEGDLALAARVEALLFVSAGPVQVNQLAQALQVPPRDVERALEVLSRCCAQRGVRLQRHRSGVQLTTATEVARDVERFLNLETTARLTRAALEVLAIVAYEQPVTRPHIDAVRGVNSDSALQTLLRHGLIEEAGRSEGPGRPILSTTTPGFLQHIGLSSLEEMPPLTPAPMPDVRAVLEAASPSAGESGDG